MSESPKPAGEEPVQQIRTEEPAPPFGEDEPDPNVVSDATVDDKASGEATDPGIGGYAEGRDPKSDMPAVPSAPETQDDPKSHDAQPGGRERWASE